MSDRRRLFVFEDEQRMAALYEAGCSLRQIGETFRCSTGPILAALERQGVARRRTNNPRGRAGKRVNRPHNARTRTRSSEKAGA